MTLEQAFGKVKEIPVIAKDAKVKTNAMVGDQIDNITTFFEKVGSANDDQHVTEEQLQQVNEKITATIPANIEKMKSDLERKIANFEQRANGFVDVKSEEIQELRAEGEKLKKHVAALRKQMDLAFKSKTAA